MSLDLTLHRPAEGEDADTQVFGVNITHNLNKMADAAGVYRTLWNPPAGTHARDLTEPVRAGLATLKADPARFKLYNPANGWGKYENLVEALEKLLAACEQHPDALVHAG